MPILPKYVRAIDNSFLEPLLISDVKKIIKVLPMLNFFIGNNYKLYIKYSHKIYTNYNDIPFYDLKPLHFIDYNLTNDVSSSIIKKLNFKYFLNIFFLKDINTLSYTFFSNKNNINLENITLEYKESLYLNNDTLIFFNITNSFIVTNTVSNLIYVLNNFKEIINENYY